MLKLTKISSALAPYLERAKGAREVAKLVADDLAGWGIKESLLPPQVSALLAKGDVAVAKDLKRLSTMSTAERTSATAKNRLVAQALLSKGNYRAPALVAHVTRPDAANSIVNSANFDSLFAGLAAKQDNTMGLADGTRVAAAAGKAVTFNDVNAAATGGSGGVALLYDPARIKKGALEAISGSDYNNHWGAAVAYPTKAIAAIQAVPGKALSASELKALKATLVGQRLYVPVVSSRGRLLFTPEEFDRLSTAAAKLPARK